jgi:hypothetical protein
MWDERRNRFTAYYKLWELAGTEVTASGEEKPFLAYMPTFTNTKLPDGKESFEGPIIHFKPNAAAEVKTQKFVLRAANQGRTTAAARHFRVRGLPSVCRRGPKATTAFTGEMNS